MFYTVEIINLETAAWSKNSCVVVKKKNGSCRSLILMLLAHVTHAHFFFCCPNRLLRIVPCVAVRTDPDQVVDHLRKSRRAAMI